MRKAISLVLVMVLGLAVEVAKADFTFGEPSKLPPPVNLTGYTSGAPSISSDGLSLFFTSDMPGQYGNYDLWVTTRAVIDDDWGVPVNLGQMVNSSAAEAYPDISSDGLSLFFQDGHPVWPELPLRPGGCGLGDLWVTKRETLADAWGTPENLGPTVNGPYWDGTPCISDDGLVLYFTSNRPGGSGDYDIWLATRKTKDEDWSAPVNLGPNVNSTDWEYGVSVSPDGLALFLMLVGSGSGGYGGCDLWMTTRVGKGQEWVAPVNLGPTVNSSIWEYRPSISACFPGSGCRLYFTRRPGMDPPSVIWETKISPIVDLNGDGIVDADDICIMVDHWGTANQLCDIGPMPWGDGIVDVQDLIVLTEHLFEGAGLVAHWALDETEGDVAYDSSGNIDAAVNEGQWIAGKIDGALQFDGFGTYMDCGDSLRLSTRKMTLAMWLEPGHMGGMRYVLSRVKERSDDFDYVLMRHRYGEMEFAVAQEGSEPVSVLSNATTPLNEWIHVAVCLDGSEATIYINGQLDASAGYAQRGSCEDCRLWISSLGKDTRFYFGKIDDVRIYNIALNSEEIAALAQ
jgi:hypothetical protein